MDNGIKLSIAFVVFGLTFNPWLVQGFIAFHFGPMFDDIGPETMATTRNLTCTEDMFYEQFPDPSDCRHYFLCFGGRLSREKCPLTTAFHPVYGCIHHTHVKNCGNTSCAVDGIYEDPKNCTRYYLCLLGEVYQFNCPEGTIFNSTMITCAKSDNTSCSDGNNGASSITVPLNFIPTGPTTTPLPIVSNPTETLTPPVLLPATPPTPTNINATPIPSPSTVPTALEPSANISLANETIGNNNGSLSALGNGTVENMKL